MTGKNDLTTRGDLASRALSITLPAIDPSSRRPEAQFWEEFEAFRPTLFGTALTLLATMLAKTPSVHLLQYPRMADFALRGASIAGSLGWTQDEFLMAYETNRRASDDSVLDQSLITEPLFALIETRNTFAGTATALLRELQSLAGENMPRRKAWPANASKLSTELRRLAPALRHAGVTVTSGKTAGSNSSRFITIRKTPQSGDAGYAGDANQPGATEDGEDCDGSDACDGELQTFPDDKARCLRCRASMSSSRVSQECGRCLARVANHATARAPIRVIPD